MDQTTTSMATKVALPGVPPRGPSGVSPRSPPGGASRGVGRGPSRSLLAAARPLLLLSRALGLVAFRVDAGAARTSRIALAHAFCVASVLLLCAALFFAWMAVDVYPHYEAKSVLASAVTKALHFGTALAAVAQLSGLRRRHVPGALRRVALADRALLAGDARRVYASTYALLCVQVTLYFVVLVGYFAWDVHVTSTYEQYGAADWVMYYAMGQVPHAFNIALTLQLVNLVAMLAHRFGRVNAQLQAVLARHRAARQGRFWRMLQEELRRCGAGEPPVAGAGAAGAAEPMGAAARMRFRKRSPRPRLRPGRRLPRFDSLPARSPPSCPPPRARSGYWASTGGADSSYAETDSDYESDERCECVCDGWTGGASRRSWASNRTSATTVASDDADGAGDVGGDVTDSATRSIRDSECSDASSEAASSDEDGAGASSFDAGKTAATREAELLNKSPGARSKNPDGEDDSRWPPRGDVNSDTAHYEAEEIRVPEGEKRANDNRDPSTAPLGTVDLRCAAGGESVAAGTATRAAGAPQRQNPGALGALDGKDSAAKEESEGRKGAEAPRRFSTHPCEGDAGAALESIAGSETHRQPPQSPLTCFAEDACTRADTNGKESANQSKEESPSCRQEEDKSCDTLGYDRSSTTILDVANDRIVSTTERTEYFGMKRAEGGEGFLPGSGNTGTPTGGGGVAGSNSEEGAASRRKRTGEEGGIPAHPVVATARPAEDSAPQEKGQMPSSVGRDTECPLWGGSHHIQKPRGANSGHAWGSTESYEACGISSRGQSESAHNYERIIIKISNGSGSKIAEDCKSNDGLIDQKSKEEKYDPTVGKSSLPKRLQDASQNMNKDAGKNGHQNKTQDKLKANTKHENPSAKPFQSSAEETKLRGRDSSCTKTIKEVKKDICGNNKDELDGDSGTTIAVTAMHPSSDEAPATCADTRATCSEGRLPTLATPGAPAPLAPVGPNATLSGAAALTCAGAVAEAGSPGNNLVTEAADPSGTTTVDMSDTAINNTPKNKSYKSDPNTDNVESSATSLATTKTKHARLINSSLNSVPNILKTTSNDVAETSFITAQSSVSVSSAGNLHSVTESDSNVSPLSSPTSCVSPYSPRTPNLKAKSVMKPLKSIDSNDVAKLSSELSVLDTTSVSVCSTIIPKTFETKDSTTITPRKDFCTFVFRTHDNANNTTNTLPKVTKSKHSAPHFLNTSLNSSEYSSTPAHSSFLPKSTSNTSSQSTIPPVTATAVKTSTGVPRSKAVFPVRRSGSVPVRVPTPCVPPVRGDRAFAGGSVTYHNGAPKSKASATIWDIGSNGNSSMNGSHQPILPARRTRASAGGRLSSDPPGNGWGSAPTASVRRIGSVPARAPRARLASTAASAPAPACDATPSASARRSASVPARAPKRRLASAPECSAPAVPPGGWDETDSEACSGACGGAARLRRLRRCHDALSEAARRLAAAFGLPLLLLLAYVFTITVSCVYYSITYGLQLYAFWLVVNTAQAVAVAWACQRCVGAARRAETLAARALLERPGAAARAELARLRRQVALGPLRFSACGLFLVDGGVLLAMAGGIASYTVIILQFECSSDAAHKSG